MSHEKHLLIAIPDSIFFEANHSPITIKITIQVSTLYPATKTTNGYVYQHLVTGKHTNPRFHLLKT